MRRATALVLSLTLGLGGCDLLEKMLSLTDLSILGIMPKPGFSRMGSADQGAAVFALKADNGQGFSLAPPLSMLEFADLQGQPIELSEEEEIPGAEAGTFVLLVDGSSSMVSSDPERFRAEAAVLVAEALERCADDWDQALLEFSTSASGGAYRNSRMLADFGAQPSEIGEAAQRLDANGATPLWDATAEVIRALREHAELHEEQLVEQGVLVAPTAAEEADPAADPASSSTGYARSLVVISDGADTSSDRGVQQVIEKAQNSGIRVHAIGLGPASDAETAFLPETQAIEELRRLALETGGTYGYVGSAEELPAQAEALAKAVCGGYTEVVATFPEPPAAGERVFGTVRLRGTPVALPFSFTAP